MISLPEELVVLLPFVLVALFCFGIFAWMSFVLWVLSRAGGWSRLAARYPLPGGVRSGTEYRWRSARIGWVSYNNCITFVATEAGLVMRMPWLFSAGHPPLLVPWHEIALIEKRMIMRVAVAVLEFGCGASAVRVTVPLALVAEIGMFPEEE